jgi:lipopolysaccharide exporter
MNNPVGLLGRCIRAGGALTIGSFLDNLFRFVRNMILARLLAPEAFGLMATVIAAVAATEAFAEVGLRQAVIQNQRGAEEDFLNVIWWLSALRGLVLYLVTFVAAPWIAQFFGKPESAVLLRVGFLVLLFNGLISPRVYVLEKELRFKNWVILMQGSGILAVVISVISAFYLRNAWALVLGYIVEAFLKALLSFVFYFFRPAPRLFRPHVKDIMRFSRGMVGLPVLMMLFVQTDTFVIGKLLSVGTLGMYSLAKDLADLPNKVFSRISPLILPTLSVMQNDLDKLRSIVLLLTKVFLTFGIPFFAFVMLFSRPILSIVYEPGYGAMAGPFAIVCVYTLLFICSSLIMNLYMAIGRPQIHRTAAAVRTGLFLALIYPATKTLGLLGASLAMLTAMAASLFIQLLYARRLIDLNLTEYFTAWLPGIWLSFIVITPSLFVTFVLNSNGLLVLGMGAFLCISTWIVALVKMNLFRSPLASST